MSNEFSGTGNIALAPTLKTVTIAGASRKVAEMRMFFDDYKPTGDGSFEQSGGFWLDVSVWGDAQAESAANLLRKGARVHVRGRLSESTWTAKDSGQEHRAFKLNADRVYLSLSRIEHVQFRAKRETTDEAAT